MTVIHYREVVTQGCSEPEIIDEQRMLDLEHFAQVCGQSQDWVIQLLEYDILPVRASRSPYQFLGEDVIRARKAYRLQRDFSASLSAVAVMLDLIDEVQQLRKQVRIYKPGQSW